MNQRIALPVEGAAKTPEPIPAPPPPEPLAEPLNADQIVELKDRITQTLCTVFDPEIPVNIYELGLIYSIEIAPTAVVGIRMTLTTPMCPVAGTLPGDVERKVRGVRPVTDVKVELVWDPPWHKDLMTEAAKLQLGIDDF